VKRLADSRTRSLSNAHNTEIDIAPRGAHGQRLETRKKVALVNQNPLRVRWYLPVSDPWGSTGPLFA
jgi:hypothetical protein